MTSTPRGEKSASSGPPKHLMPWQKIRVPLAPSYPPAFPSLPRYEMNPDPDASPHPGMIFVLVHGTYVPKTRWTQPGSEFRANLREATSSCGPINFYEFVWRGALGSRFNNSHRLRLNAGQQLRAHLHRLAEEHPGVPLFVVGHSHGGNVVLYALRDLRLRRHITGIITLATTHMVFEPRRPIGALRAVYLLTALYTVGVLSGALWLSLQIANFWVLPLLLLAGGAALLPSWLNQKYKIIHRFLVVVAQLHRRFSYISTPPIKEVPHFWGCARWGGHSERLNMESMLTALPRFGLNQWLFNMQVSCFALSSALGYQWWGLPGLVGGFPLGIIMGTLFSNLLVVLTLPVYVARTLAATSAAVPEGELFRGGESVLFHSVGKIVIRKMKEVFPAHPLDELREYPVEATFEHNIYDHPAVQRDVAEWILKIWQSKRPKKD